MHAHDPTNSTNINSIFFIFILLACGAKHHNQESVTGLKNYHLTHYDLKEPTEIMYLESELEEISGLVHLTGSIFLSVQDEDGIVYKIDFAQKKVIDRFKFGPDGDYEGITIQDEWIWVINSSGVLFRFQWGDRESVAKVKTALSGKNDVEGLCFDRLNNSLLIACKAQPDVGGVKRKGKAIYAFDLDLKKIYKEPRILVTRSQVKKILQIEDITLRPSGIAIHPLTGETFVLSSNNRLVMIFDKERSLHEVAFLPKKVLRQPEGISFDEFGGLYISTEASDKKPLIAKYVSITPYE